MCLVRSNELGQELGSYSVLLHTGLKSIPSTHGWLWFQRNASSVFPKSLLGSPMEPTESCQPLPPTWDAPLSLLLPTGVGWLFHCCSLSAQHIIIPNPSVSSHARQFVLPHSHKALDTQKQNVNAVYELVIKDDVALGFHNDAAEKHSL